MNTVGVFVSFFSAALTLYLAKNYFFPSSVYGTAPAVAYQTSLFLPTGIFFGWLASLLTPPLKSETVNRFFVKIHTPIGKEEKLDLPLDEAIPTRERLIDAGGLFIVKPSLESCLGFMVAWGIVLLLIFGTQFLLRL